MGENLPVCRQQLFSLSLALSCSLEIWPKLLTIEHPSTALSNREMPRQPLWSLFSWQSRMAAGNSYGTGQKSGFHYQKHIYTHIFWIKRVEKCLKKWLESNQLLVLRQSLQGVQICWRGSSSAICEQERRSIALIERSNCAILLGQSADSLLASQQLPLWLQPDLALIHFLYS